MTDEQQLLFLSETSAPCVCVLVRCNRCVCVCVGGDGDRENQSGIDRRPSRMLSSRPCTNRTFTLSSDGARTCSSGRGILNVRDKRLPNERPVPKSVVHFSPYPTYVRFLPSRSDRALNEREKIRRREFLLSKSIDLIFSFFSFFLCVCVDYSRQGLPYPPSGYAEMDNAVPPDRYGMNSHSIILHLLLLHLHLHTVRKQTKPQQ